MNYTEVIFKCSPNDQTINDILNAELAEIGFDSFVEEGETMKAYIQESLFDEKAINEIIEHFPLEASISFTYNLILDQNWNAEWEKNYFQPLLIDNECIIRSTFHERIDNFRYEIVIDPKMAFGTGHHQTTELMIHEILATDIKNKAVLDMGCGTAILAILASMRGASPITAIDIDEWAYNNAIENLELNNISNIEVLLGGSELLSPTEKTFDIILANINRNILLEDIKKYASVLNFNGTLYMSGFYTEDIIMIKEECKKYGIIFNHSNSKDNWAAVKFTKRTIK